MFCGLLHDNRRECVDERHARRFENDVRLGSGGARLAACGRCTRASQKRTSSMSFAEKHPYLFWQLIGWGILLVDFVFTVIAIFNDFGEWSYPIIVFTFIGALFAFIGSPCCLYAKRATRMPQARSPEEDRAVRSKLTAVAMARKTPQAALLGALVVLAGVTYGDIRAGHARACAAWVRDDGRDGGRSVRDSHEISGCAAAAVHEGRARRAIRGRAVGSVAWDTGPMCASCTRPSCPRPRATALRRWIFYTTGCAST